MYYVNASFSFVISLVTLIWNGVSGFFDALNPLYPLSLYYHSKNMKRILNSVMLANVAILISNYVLYSIGEYVYILSYLNWIVWFVPMWIFSDYVNRSLQTEMMDKLCADKYAKKENSKPSINTSKQITDVLYETIFFACIHLLLFISNSYWSKTLYLIGYSLVCSYSLMSYRLIYTQYSLQDRMKLFEKYWVYFIFYGLPYGLVYVLLPTPISYPVFYILVSWTLPNTLRVLPKKGLILPFKIFYIPEYLVNCLSLMIPKILQKKT